MTDTRDVIEHEERVRRRLAERLHDGPIQELTAAQLFLETALYSDDVPGGVGRAGAMLRDAAVACRRFMDLLSPALEGDGELARSIETMAQDVTPTVIVDVSLPAGFGRSRPAVVLTIYRAAEELLDNVRRHADGKLEAVIVRADAAGATLAVMDRGSGGCAEPAVARGGLAVTAERVASLGGAVTVEQRDPGTAVSVFLPVGTDA